MRRFALSQIYRNIQSLTVSTPLRHKLLSLRYSILSLFGLRQPVLPYAAMDVSQTRFPMEIVRIIEEIADSHFVAFDLEFSGVAGRRQGGTGGKLSLEEYYEDIKNAAEKYQILQVGLTIVKEESKQGRYTARPYNFNISPLTPLRERYFGRTWSYQSGAISFLMRNGFKFDLPLTQGIQYLSRKEEHEARAAYIQEEEARSKIADMAPKKEDNILIDHIRTSVQRWQALPKHEQTEYLNIPGEGAGIPEVLNRYQVRLTHQIIRNEYPRLKTTGIGHFVQVTNPTAEQQASEKLLQEAQREREVMKAVGFRWIIEAIMAGDISSIPDDYLLNLSIPKMIEQSPQAYLKHLQAKLRNRRRVIVGHNCFTDLVNLYKCFIGDLPATVEGFQDKIHDLFPAVVDTKHMASFGSKRWGNTSLEDVEGEMRIEPRPHVNVPGEFDRYQHSSSYHEAGYDSLLTAKIAIKLSAKMEREGKYLDADQSVLQPIYPPAAAFGTEEDGYVTAAESVSSDISTKGSFSETVKDIVSTPITAVKMAFNKDETVPKSQGAIGEGQPNSKPASFQEVIAVKEKFKPTKWTDKDEVEKVKVTLAKTNIYEVLEKDSTGPESENEDLMSFSSGSSEKNTPQKSRNLDLMVKKGEIMPRWDGSNGFWQRFGNKLQVNGSKEGICVLV